MPGRRTIHANEVFFDNVHAPAAYRLGNENAARHNMMKRLAFQQLCLASISAGHCFKITEYAPAYPRDRMQFGHPITDYQAVSRKLIDMAITPETARQSIDMEAEYQIMALIHFRPR